ncbi:RNA-directed DNA polymerase, eukaryota, reverse transcriptase zinc-binding domain protein [Tanacetum coccineum]
MNKVRDESERYGTIFSPTEAQIFNNFIDNLGLLDLPLGGRSFTWMNKEGTKMSKLDRFLVSSSVMDAFPNLRVTALPRGWSDHIPLMLHDEKNDYGPIPFKFFHSWLKKMVIKLKIKAWHNMVKHADISRKKEVMLRILEIDENIDKCTASDVEKQERLVLLKECDDLTNLEDMDMMVKGIMIDGEWVMDPHRVKLAFFNFYKEKFEARDAKVNLITVTPQVHLDLQERNALEDNVSNEEIKAALFKLNVEATVRDFFDHFAMPKGANSSFITLIPKVANPIHIKDFRPISLIGVHYKIIAKILANRLAKVVDKVGDLLNPFLFIIIMEGLNIALKDAVASGLIHGTKVGDANLNISHLFYADDVVIVSEWNKQDMENIIRVMQVFNLASGLKINISKSNVYGIGVSSEEIEDMARVTGCASGSLPFIYLGLPIGSNMNLIANWQFMIDRFRRRMSTWKANMLIGYKKSRSLRASFFWGGSGENKKMTWIKWDNILASHDKGGLGIGSLKAFNLALLQKWRWRLVTFSNSLWARVVKAIHGDDTGMELKGCKVSGKWANIVDSFSMLHSKDIIPLHTLRHKVGNGSSIRFWKDNWIGSRNEESLEILKTEIGRVQVNDCPDSWHWNDGDVGVFSVSATRMHVDNCILPSLSPNLFQWLEDWGSSKDYKDRVYVISAAALWILWRYRNSITFNSHPMRKSDIFDSIHTYVAVGAKMIGL